jgi:hypothetical protein
MYALNYRCEVNIAKANGQTRVISSHCYMIHETRAAFELRRI